MNRYMNDYNEIYELSSDITPMQLINVGVSRGGILNNWLYGNLIQIELHINMEEKSFAYEVIDIDHNQLYIPYYNNCCGNTNSVLSAVNNNVDKFFKNLEKKKILIRRSENEKNSKI